MMEKGHDGRALSASRRGLWSVAKKERDESAFVAEGEGAGTLKHKLCARVWVRVCPWNLLGLAGLQGCRKEKRQKKNVPWARGAKASGWTFENGADVCWRPPWVPVPSMEFC